jgi:hypothetical protein
VIEKVPRIKTLKVAPTKFDFFTYEELDQLVEAAREEPEWQAAIMVAGGAGLRMGEVLALQLGGSRSQDRNDDRDAHGLALIALRRPGGAPRRRA